jgi:hypothetical protein
MSTIVPGLFNINGVIDTNQSVLQNIQAIAEAAGCWMTYDVNDGQWAVVINRPGTAVATFDDSNIVGSINIFGSGINEMYNAVSIEFPHKDLRDQTDYIDLEIPLEDRFPNELDNRLNIRSDLINNPIQAQYAASIALKQTRADKIIEFTTDYTSLGLKAGDLISVTSSMVNYTAKIFRIISMSENDEDVISVTIRALEYDANVYSTAGLIRKERNKKTGIVPKASNAALTQSDAAKTAQQVNTALQYSQQQGLSNKVLSRLFGKKPQLDNDGQQVYDIFGNPTVDNGQPIYDIFGNPIKNGQPVFDIFGNPIYSDVIVPEGQAGVNFDNILNGLRPPPLTTISGSATVCEGPITITAGHSCTNCLFDIPALEYDYSISGVPAGSVSIPLTGKVSVADGTGSLPFSITGDGVEDGFQTATITIGGQTTTRTVYNQKGYTYSLARSSSSITEGESVTITVTGTGTKVNATVPYQITGTATGKVTTSLTGTITITGGTGTLVINTSDDAIFTGNQSLTVTIAPGLVDPCGTVGTRFISVTVLDNETPPEPPVPTTTCIYVTVPAVLCAIYEGGTGELQGLTVRRSVQLPVAQAGEASIAVPLTFSVTKGNPSTINVLTTVNVATSAALGGFPINIVTSYNTIPPLGLLTGTVQTIYGYF